MKILYTVHTVADGTAQAEVALGGKKIIATVPTLDVELISDDPGQSNPLLRIPPDEIEAARKLFVPDAKVSATFAAAK